MVLMYEETEADNELVNEKNSPRELNLLTKEFETMDGPIFRVSYGAAAPYCGNTQEKTSITVMDVHDENSVMCMCMKNAMISDSPNDQASVFIDAEISTNNIPKVSCDCEAPNDMAFLRNRINRAIESFIAYNFMKPNEELKMVHGVDFDMGVVLTGNADGSRANGNRYTITLRFNKSIIVSERHYLIAFLMEFARTYMMATYIHVKESNLGYCPYFNNIYERILRYENACGYYPEKFIDTACYIAAAMKVNANKGE